MAQICGWLKTHRTVSRLFSDTPTQLAGGTVVVPGPAHRRPASKTPRSALTRDRRRREAVLTLARNRNPKSRVPRFNHPRPRHRSRQKLRRLGLPPLCGSASVGSISRVAGALCAAVFGAENGYHFEECRANNAAKMSG